MEILVGIVPAAILKKNSFETIDRCGLPSHSGFI